MTGSKDSPPPIIADLVPRHNQIVELNRSSGSTSIDDNKVFAKKLLGEVLANQRAALMEGKDGDVALLEIINEKNLRVDHVHKYTDLRSFYGMEESHKAMIVSEDEENTCLVFTCMQIASAITSPANAHRLGNCAIVFFSLMDSCIPRACGSTKASHLSSLHLHETIDTASTSYERWMYKNHCIAS
jgi:hypothetical protein